jgi:hypothetical protein
VGSNLCRFYRIAPLTAVPRPRIGLGWPCPLTSQGLDLKLEGLCGFSYGVDFSTDLVSWSRLTTFVSTNAVMFFRDAAATNSSRRFYRALMQ